MINFLIPKSIKLSLRLLNQLITDLLNGNIQNFAKARKKDFNLKHTIQITQQLRPNKNKLQNLILASKSIEPIVILPGEIFSFWKAVGQPSRQNGYVESRSIVNNKIKNTIGGGLCQISGLIYHLSLLCGLETIERHNHSKDIYNESTRFAPLGSDATIVYGYKDLRVKNNLGFPVQFKFVFKNSSLTIVLNSLKEVKCKNVSFLENGKRADVIEVFTLVNNKKIVESIYERGSA